MNRMRNQSALENEMSVIFQTVLLLITMQEVIN
ncbi:hypothetical protein PPOLYM_05107 [Paenibacillus polymyxa]|uniref:Uncharacterized protein n=1 Tax=Paenibacillus peoriae TaxID=59893 RepID=A0ABU1QMN2_9BACL|nr:hypothetical protein [Paenibacillus peoriae]VUG08662.1 hypothetical protein PPOLYM_05107 [Paenibacillus polymyxa]